jgi:hypothetical protein
MFASLEKMPVRKARVNFALKVRVQFKDDPRWDALADRWATDGSDAVKKAIARGRR